MLSVSVVVTTSGRPPKAMPLGVVKVEGRSRDFGEIEIVAGGASQSHSQYHQRSAIYHHQKKCLMDLRRKEGQGLW